MNENTGLLETPARLLGGDAARQNYGKNQVFAESNKLAEANGDVGVLNG